MLKDFAHSHLLYAGDLKPFRSNGQDLFANFALPARFG
jgi:hypothetical protein